MKTSLPMSLPKLRLPFLVAVMAALPFLPVSGYPQGPASNENQPWGLWVQKIPLGGGLNIQELVSFHFDGTVSGTGSPIFGGVPPFAANRSSSIFGGWEKKGPKTIAGTTYVYNFDAVSGLLTGYGRARWTMEFSDDFKSYTGTASLASLSCPTPLNCPDPADPSVVWTPGFTGFTVLGSRLK